MLFLQGTSWDDQTEEAVNEVELTSMTEFIWTTNLLQMQCCLFQLLSSYSLLNKKISEEPKDTDFDLWIK